MELSLALVKSKDQLIIKTMSESKIIDITDFSDFNVQGIFYPKSFEDDENLIPFFTDQRRYFPIRCSDDFDLSLDKFESLNESDLKKYAHGLTNTHRTISNLVLIEEVLSISNQLKELWPNNRTDFFEEIWFLLKRNLGATSLKLVYNELLKGKKEHEKNKLIQVCIDGTRAPNPVEGKEFEKEAIKTCEQQLNGSIFEVVEYSKETGKLVINASINKGPILIMAELFDFGPLQKAVISSLFSHLQSASKK